MMKTMTGKEQEAGHALEPGEFERDKPNGPALAAIVAAGVGSFVLGLFTTLAAASEGIKDWLKFREPVGPLAGKTTLAVIAYFASWIVLGYAWKNKTVDFRKAVIVTAVLIGLGILGTYPSFFESFEPKG